jgi:predicted transglutaminase-like cysteine proteinase
MGAHGWAAYTLALISLQILAGADVGADPILAHEPSFRRSDLSIGTWNSPHGRSPLTNELQRVADVNDHYNRFRSISDSNLWGVADYWAAPAQLIAVGAGDCEDFALAKFAALVKAGVSPRRLWLTYTRALQPRTRRIESHMVLVYHSVDHGYWVLDNLRKDVAPLVSRTDLSVSTALNASGVWQLSKTDPPQLLAGPDALPPRARSLLAEAAAGAALASANDMPANEVHRKVR